MPPKKKVQKEVEQPPKEVIPQIPLHEREGFGRFSYPNGAQYTGEWKLVKGIKMKYGKGTLVIQKMLNSQVGKEMYEGQWIEDEMDGQGTYYYADGSVYKGNWKTNQHSGQGVYEFPNGTIYEGEWKNHQMNGTGFFIDSNGRKWGGQFRSGQFQSKNQAELVKEKAITLKQNEIKKEVEATFVALLQAIAKSDKKTLKENLTPFFPTPDSLKDYIKEPYSKFDQRPPEKWTQLITIAKSGTFTILQDASQATLIAPQRILVKQLEGNGQFVEVQGSKDDKIVKIGLGGADTKKWLIVCAAEEQKKK